MMCLDNGGDPCLQFQAGPGSAPRCALPGMLSIHLGPNLWHTNLSGFRVGVTVTELIYPVVMIELSG